MGSHSDHLRLPGYHPAQVLHDGCAECEHRSEDITAWFAHADTEEFERAWRRAADWQASRPPSGERAEGLSETELPLLRVLWAVQVRLESRGIPLGCVPAYRTEALADGYRDEGIHTDARDNRSESDV